MGSGAGAKAGVMAGCCHAESLLISRKYTASFSGNCR